jgi:aspartate carbamoyltransferase catalytic subunit
LRFPQDSIPKKSFETDKIENVIADTDVLYVTRVQTERGSDHQYSLSTEQLNLLPKNSIVMHPLPRVNEIPRDFDNDPRAKYFDQMIYGLWCRMVLLEGIMS